MATEDHSSGEVPVIFIPTGEFDPFALLERVVREQSEYGNFWTEHDSSDTREAIAESHRSAVLWLAGTFGERWRACGLRRSGAAMHADAAEALARARSETAGSIEQFDLILRHLQSLLAGRLGVQIRYRAFDDDRGPAMPDLVLRTPDDVCEYVQTMVLHYVAMGYIRGLYSGVVTSRRISGELSGLFHQLSGGAVDLIAGLAPPAAWGEAVGARNRIQIIRSAIFVSAMHACHALRMNDLETIEPLLAGRRSADVLFEAREDAATAVKELARLDGALNDADLRSPHFGDGLHSVSKILAKLDDSRAIAAGVSEASVKVGRVDFAQLKSPSNRPNWIEATRAVAFNWLRDLAILTWTREAPISELLDELLRSYPSSSITKLRAELFSCVEEIMQSGIAEETGGVEFRARPVAPGVLSAIAADGGARSLLLRLPSWHLRLIHVARQAYLSSEFAYSAYLDHRPSPRIGGAPSDWSPVLLGYAVALEAELCLRPHRHAVESLRDDEAKWPTSRLEKLASSRDAYREQGLAKEVLRSRREPMTSREPTLGQLASYFQWGVDRLARGDGADRDDLVLDWIKLIQRHQQYARLLNPAFVAGLKDFVRYRNWAAHPHEVLQEQLQVARRMGTSMLESLADCQVGRSRGSIL